MGDVYVIALSGPEETRAQAEVALEAARIPLLPDDHHAMMNWGRKFPGDECAWLACAAEDVNAPVRAVESAGWALRVHYPMPEASKPNPIAATLAEMRAEIDTLKARVGA